MHGHKNVFRSHAVDFAREKRRHMPVFSHPQKYQVKDRQAVFIPRDRQDFLGCFLCRIFRNFLAP